PRSRPWARHTRRGTREDLRSLSHDTLHGNGPGSFHLAPDRARARRQPERTQQRAGRSRVQVQPPRPAFTGRGGSQGVAMKLRIRIADDEELIRKSLVKLLTAEGYEVDAVGSAAEVLES